MPTGIYQHQNKGNATELQLKYWESIKGKPSNVLGKHWKIKKKYKRKSQQGFQPGHTLRLGKTENLAGNWKGDNAGKKAMHVRIVKKSGKAKDYKCVDCGEQAEDWSNINNHIYTDKIEDYLPRCKKCHRKYDNQ